MRRVRTRSSGESKSPVSRWDVKGSNMEGEAAGRDGEKSEKRKSCMRG